MPRMRDEHGEFVRTTPYVAGLTMSNPSVVAWRFYECAGCGMRHWAEPLPDQSKRQTIVEEVFCSASCQEEWEMLEKDRQEQDGIEVWVESHNYERVLGFLHGQFTANANEQGARICRDEAFRLMLTLGSYRVSNGEILQAERSRLNRKEGAA